MLLLAHLGGSSIAIVIVLEEYPDPAFLVTIVPFNQRNVYKECRLRGFSVTRDHVKLVCTR